MKTVLRLMARLFFRFRAYNQAVLKTPGPVLLIPNHQSLIDWFFLGVCLEDDWKFVVSRVAAQTTWLHRKITINRRTFLIDNASPYALKRMAEHLQGGGRLVLFAEGRLSRTGSLMKLFGRVEKGINVRVGGAKSWRTLSAVLFSQAHLLYVSADPISLVFCMPVGQHPEDRGIRCVVRY